MELSLILSTKMAMTMMLLSKWSKINEGPHTEKRLLVSLGTAVTAVRPITNICIPMWCLRKKDSIYKNRMLDINTLIQIKINAKQCWNRSNTEKNRKMKPFACCNQILFRNVLSDCICALCRACNFYHNKRIFNSNERRILIKLVFSPILPTSNPINSCLLIFTMHHILCLLSLH